LIVFVLLFLCCWVFFYSEFEKSDLVIDLVEPPLLTNLSLTCSLSSSKPLDLVFVVEAISIPINNYYFTLALQSLIKNIIHHLPKLSRNGLNIGLIKYSSYPSTVVDITSNSSYSKSSIYKKIRSTLTTSPDRVAIGSGVSHAFHMLSNHRIENSKKIVIIIAYQNPSYPVQFTSPISGKTYEAPQCSGGGDNPIDTGRRYLWERMIQLQYAGIDSIAISMGLKFNPDQHTLAVLSQGSKDRQVLLYKGLELVIADNNNQELMKDMVQLILEKICQVAQEQTDEMCMNTQVKEWYPW